MKTLATLLASLSLSAGAFAASDMPPVGVVNFATCIADSKCGKQEQASFEALKKQMTTLLEDTEKQLRDISTKLNDADHMDGLSPEGEAELKGKFQALSEEMGRYQNQYYQVLNQANMKLFQVVSSNINTASEKVAKDKKLALVINKEACPFYTNSLDVTPEIINEMDKSFEKAISALPKETK